jgi:alpha-2-macroglobulin
MAAQASAKSEMWYRYINAHTSGAVSRSAPVRVIFHEAVKGAGVGHGPAMSDIMTIEPSVRGELTWQSDREMVFSPMDPLEAGRHYEVTLKLAKWLPLEKGMDLFKFAFAVNPQSMEMEMRGLESQGQGDLFTYHGVLNTADMAGSEQVEKVVAAEMNGKTLGLTWEHEKGGLVHRFKIENIQRTDRESALDIRFDGSPIGVENRGRESVRILAKNQFGVISVTTTPGAEHAVRIQFSESLAPDQALASLITIPGKEVRLQASGALVTAYFAPESTEEKVVIHFDAALRSGSGLTLKKKHTEPVSFLQIPPQVRFIGKGAILPQNDRLTVPFEAVNLRSVQVTAFEIYSENLSQFLQNNDYGGEEELFRVGRHLWRKTISLDGDNKDLSRWNRFALDVTGLLEEHKGSMIRLALSFNRGNSAYPCQGEMGEIRAEPPLKDSDAFDNPEHSNWDFWNDYYQYESGEELSWRNRDNPCNEAYYSFRFNRERVWVARNFFSSDLGLMAKMGDDSRIWVTVNRISSGEAVGGARVSVYDFQNRLLGEGTANGDGMVNLPLERLPYLVVCEQGREKGFLKVNGDTALPVSHFDVGGQEANRGIKGILYGERGVWRPGDDLHVMLAVWDRDGKLPKDHPVELEWFDPRGRLVRKFRPLTSQNGFYRFLLTTEDDAPTGNWTAKARLGGKLFQKTFKIETVVPNRLKIEFKTAQETVSSAQPTLTGDLLSQWLHGAPASNLRYTVFCQYNVIPTQFKTHTDFVFDDVTREFSASRKELDDGYLDEAGRARVNLDLSTGGNSPGRLSVQLETQVFEKGGQFSVDRFPVVYDPYTAYVGIRTPKGDLARGMLLTDTDQKVEVMSLDPRGNPLSRQKIEMSLYKIHWRWWWEKDADSLAQYAMDQNIVPLQKGVLATRNGEGSWTFSIKYPDWGRYLIRAYDPESGHASSRIVYIDWPGWAGKAREESGSGATRLELTLDKETYQVGDKAQLTLPHSIEGRALLTIENSRGVVRSEWLDTGEKRSTYELPVTADMAPNVYVGVTLLMPHRGRKTDTPIRLYGVVPMLVSDPKTVLKPEIVCADTFAPKSEVEIKVREGSGQSMTYTLALVDEGLLGLTRFKTTDLHTFFYAKEALTVKSWDLYDWVVGAYGAELESILGIGGDEQGVDQQKAKQKRFPPVVEFLGPFTLKAGEKGQHRVKLGNYVGALRVMVVAGNQGRYGWAEKGVPVRSDLMLAPTLPRVVRPGETLSLPVEIFSQRSGSHSVKVEIIASGDLRVMGDNAQEIVLSGPSEKTVFFDIEVLDRLGTADLTVRAQSGGKKAEDLIHLPILAANPPTRERFHATAEGRGSWRQKIMPLGIPGSGKLLLELSAVPPLHASDRLSSLIAYPHGCLEQTVSKLFPQLYLNRLAKLTADEQRAIQDNLQLGMEKISGFLSASGGFSYWPGSDQVHGWTSVYAGHFLLEARNLGYTVPATLVDPMLSYQRQAANRWRLGSEPVLLQVYRLFVLSLGRSPDVGAMNRLRDFKNLDPQVAGMLGASFYLAGQAEAAQALLADASRAVRKAEDNDQTFATPLRDEALLLWAQVRGGSKRDLSLQARRLSESLAENAMYSTQEMAFTLMALAEYYGSRPNAGPVKGELIINGQKESFSFDTPVMRSDLSAQLGVNGLDLVVNNPGTDRLFVSWSREGVPLAGQETAAASALKMETRYTDLEGNPLDITRVKQGQDLLVTVTVRNTTRRRFENLALSHLIPAGFQVTNARFSLPGQSPGLLDYQDLRDDRVYSYFGLKAEETKVVTLHVNASFSGRYYLPGIRVEAMYDPGVFAASVGQWININR